MGTQACAGSLATYLGCSETDPNCNKTCVVSQDTCLEAERIPVTFGKCKKEFFVLTSNIKMDYLIQRDY